jgi:small subunit ribosomal protein S2
MGEHILEIIVILLGAAILGFLIGWLLKNNKISELQAYVSALEDKNNRLQSDYNKNEKILIDCQTEKRKAEAEKREVEKLLIEYKEQRTLPDMKPEKKEIKPVSKKKALASKTKIKTDNLTKIEGIGPKISSILTDAGISGFKKLSSYNKEKITEILTKAGGNTYKRFDPSTWPEQAKLAAEDKWDELKIWQEELKGGRKK